MENTGARHGWIACCCLWLLAGCEDVPSTGIDKHQARETDPGSWSTDYCASEGWYGDGECDEFCPSPDGDCDPALEAKARAFLDSYVADYAVAERDQQLAYWNASVSGAAADYKTYNDAQVKLFTLHLDKERAGQLKPLFDERAKLSLFTRRSLEVAEPNFMAVSLPVTELPKLLKVVQLRNDVLALFNNYSATLDGHEHSLQELRTELEEQTDGGERQQIWQALKEIGPQVAPQIVEAVKLGNEVAETMGYPSYWHYALESSDFDPAELEALFDEVEAQTRTPYAQVKQQIDQEVAARFGIDPNEVEIWHYDQEFFILPPPSKAFDLNTLFQGKSAQQVVEIAAGFLAKLGLPVDDVVKRSDLYERDGKWPGAFTVTVDRKNDIRVLMNARPDHGSLATALHELGHAIDHKHLDPQLPFLLRTASHILTTEAVAMFIEDQSLTPEFLVQAIGADPAVVDKVKQHVLEQYRRQELVFARFAVVMFRFEKAIYANPGQDLNKLWWDLVEKYQLIKRPADREQPDWATKTHFSSSPVYYHNYMLGKLFDAQLRATLARITSYEGPLLGFCLLGRPAAVDLLKQKIFRVGKRQRWWEMVRLATDEPLEVDAFAQQMGTPAL
jgi:peptidyl-dipeptidase A